MLFEASHRFHETLRQVPPIDLADLKETSLSKSDGDTSDASEEDQSSTKANAQDAKEEQVEYQSLGVAVLEGWLHQGPDDETMRWRIAALREPWEFAHSVTAERVVLGQAQQKGRSEE